MNLLATLFIKNHKNTTDQQVRTSYGVLCSFLGIALNLLLFIGKILAGMLSHSIAITADAFNNLSDAGSSIITLLGFRLANQKPDSDHPYGHGRFEYISGFVVSMLILLMSYELITSSIDKIFHPQSTTYTPLVFGILIASILVKLYMYLYNKSIGQSIDSSALLATATDSLSDSISTGVVLLCSIICYFTSYNVEGYCGVLVGLFVGFAGYNAAKDTLSPLLGCAPEESFVKEIEDIVLAGEGVLGIHDLEVHDYGPGRVMISIHAEVSADGDFLAMHDVIDNIEHELMHKLNCRAVIHMDPICDGDEETMQLRDQIITYLHSISEVLTLHDFRIVKGPTHCNILFDVVSPFDFHVTDKELTEQLKTFVRSLDSTYFAIIEIDKK
ncbi:MAG: cation diffusion facilitator family transporter [Lachnospiraceae bacterium]